MKKIHLYCTCIVILLAALAFVIVGEMKSSKEVKANISLVSKSLIKQTTENKQQEKTTEKETTEKIINKNITIALDAGHGGNNSGSKIGDVWESKINYAIALKVREKLQEKGYKVLFRKDYDDISFDKRAEISNSGNANFFVSIHVNSEGTKKDGSEMTDGTAYGIETHYTTKDNVSKKYADLIQNELTKTTGAYDRGLVESSDFLVFLKTIAPSVLIETGFITNRDEREKLVTDTYQTQIADGIVLGIEKCFP